MRLLEGSVNFFSSVFEFGGVAPIEVGLYIFADGMEILAHTIALFVLVIVFFLLIFSLLIMAPIFLPILYQTQEIAAALTCSNVALFLGFGIREHTEKILPSKIDEAIFTVHSLVPVIILSTIFKELTSSQHFSYW